MILTDKHFRVSVFHPIAGVSFSATDSVFAPANGSTVITRDGNTCGAINVWLGSNEVAYKPNEKTT